MEIIVKLIFALAFLFVFVLASLKLHPFRKHHVWNVSTFYLKFSYLAYIGFVLLYSYLSIFYRNAFLYNPNWVNDTEMSLFHLFILLLYMAPTGLIMLRKHVHNRKPFNIISGSLNIIFSWCLISLIVRFYLLYMTD